MTPLCVPGGHGPGARESGLETKTHIYRSQQLVDIYY